jgi:hypothetical protein
VRNGIERILLYQKQKRRGTAWEVYKLLHSRKLLLIFALFFLIIIYMYGVSIGNPVLQIYVWELPEEWLEPEHRTQTNLEIRTLIQEVEYYGGITGWTEKYFWIEEDSLALFEEGEAL